MPIVTLQNGKSYSFPTQTAADAFKKEVGMTTQKNIQQGNQQNPQSLLQRIRQGNQQKTDVLVGAGKEGVNFLRGTSSLGERFLRGTLKTILPKSVENKFGVQNKEYQTGAEQLIPESAITPTNKYQKIGAGAAQIGEYMVPALGATKVATTGMKIANILSRAVQSGTIASAQSGGKIGKETAIVAGTEVALPVVSKALKPVTSVIGRLFSGFGAALSGLSSDGIKIITENPRVAKEISEQIIKDGQESVLETNARKIIDGISTLNKKASAKYEAGLQKLSKTDIKPKVIYDNLIEKLKDNKINVSKSGLNLSNSEILDKNLQSKAKNIILQVNKMTNASGNDIRNMLKILEASKFKSAVDPNRAAFNNLMNDLASGLKKAINESTNKLSSINKEYSTTKALTDGIQNIFGKVKFKNTSELNNVARKLEGLFSKKGLDNKTVDEFLSKIGENPSEFRTAEAVRNIYTKTTGANTKGLTFAEILQQITSSVVTPQAVQNIAVTTGISKEVLDKLITTTEPAVRGAILKFLIDLNKE